MPSFLSILYAAGLSLMTQNEEYRPIRIIAIIISKIRLHLE